MARRMRQRHEHPLPTPFPLPDVVLDDRVAAGEVAFLAEPVEYPLGRMMRLRGMLRSASSQPSMIGMTRQASVAEARPDADSLAEPKTTSSSEQCPATR